MDMPEHNRPRQSFKIILVGDALVGKSSLLQRYLNKGFGAQNCTTGTDLAVKVLTIKDQSVRLHIWHITHMSSKGFEAYFRGADGILVCFDLKYPKTLENLQRWLENLQSSPAFSNVSKDVKMILVGTKSDLRRTKEERTQTETQIDKWCREHNNIPYIETSAKENINVDQAFTLLAQIILEAKPTEQNHYEEQQQPIVDLDRSGNGSGLYQRCYS